MTDDERVEPTDAQIAQRVAEIAPKFADLTHNFVFGEMWERPGLSKRERSLITVAALVSLDRGQPLEFHLRRALENGVTRDELAEVITHLAIYAGFPCASKSALMLAKIDLGG